MPHSKIIEQRLRFFMFDDDTVQTLRQAEDIFNDSIDDLLDRMYNHVLAQPELKSLFPDEESIERARNAQKLHWQRILFSKGFGETQFEETKKVGQTHLRVGLECSSYMSAYCLMLNEFIELIIQQFKGDAKNLTKIVQALNKAIVLDMSFVVEAYFEAKNSAMKEILHRSTDFAEDVKHLTDDLTHTAQDLSKQTELIVTGSERSEGEQSQPKEDQANIRKLLKCTDKLSGQVDKLNSRLDELMFGDRLYVGGKQDTNFFTRLKNFLGGN